MSCELEDVFILDHRNRTIINLSDAIPKEYKYQDMVINPEDFVSDGREIFGIHYFSTEETTRLQDRLLKSGGSRISPRK